MKNAELFVLEVEGGLFGYTWAWADKDEPVNIGESEKCPVCGHPLSGRAWLEPHIIRLCSARPEKWPDFLFGAGFDLMVSRRWVEVYHQEGLTGITRFHPEARILSAGRKLMSELPEPRPAYMLVDVCRSRARIDLQASGRVATNPKQPLCQECLMDGSILSRIGPLVFEPGTWSGEDIFFARGLAGTIFVSSRLAEAVARSGLKGADLIPVEEYVLSFELKGGLARGCIERVGQGGATGRSRGPGAEK